MTRLISGRRIAPIALFLALVTIATTPMAMAATNIGTGDVAGAPSSLAQSTDFILTTTTLQLYKRAFLPDGTVVGSGTSVPAGTTVKFMIYVHNDTLVPLNDLSLRDALDGGTFVYQTDSIRVLDTQDCLATVCTVGEELTIFNAVEATGALTDAELAGDAVSWDGTNVDVGNSQDLNNDQVNVPAGNVYAVTFAVVMQ